MKQILVAIDFSDCSINALEHALTIAEKAKADVKMVWINRPDASKEIFSGEPENLEAEVEKRFEELKRKYRIGFRNGKLDYAIRKGKVYKEIVKEADDMDAGMIVAGTHGSSGFEEFWAGSNANKIVSATKRPVITIRGGVDIGRNLKKVVLPIDSTLETRQKVPFTAYLAKLFRAEVHVVALHSTNVKAIQSRVNRYAYQVLEHLEIDKIKHHMETVKASNITDATIEYATGIEANLISIMKEQEKATSNLWMGPYASQMVNHSPIPVLSIDIKELMMVTGG